MVILFFVSCGNDPTQDPILQEAFSVHQSSLETEKEVIKHMETLRDFNVEHTNFIRNESNSDEVKAKVEAFENGSVKSAMAHRGWKQELPEIPGFEHTHADGSVHNHDAPMRITAEEMLEVQKEFRDSIITIKKNIIQLIEDFKAIKPK